MAACKRLIKLLLRIVAAIDAWFDPPTPDDCPNCEGIGVEPGTNWDICRDCCGDGVRRE